MTASDSSGPKITG